MNLKEISVLSCVLGLVLVSFVVAYLASAKGQFAALGHGGAATVPVTGTPVTLGRLIATPERFVMQNVVVQCHLTGNGYYSEEYSQFLRLLQPSVKEWKEVFFMLTAKCGSHYSTTRSDGFVFRVRKKSIQDYLIDHLDSHDGRISVSGRVVAKDELEVDQIYFCSPSSPDCSQATKVIE